MRPSAGKSSVGWRCVFQYWRGERERAFRQWHIAIFRTLAVPHMKQRAPAVNVGDAQIRSLLQTQAAGVDGAETDTAGAAV